MDDSIHETIMVINGIESPWLVCSYELKGGAWGMPRYVEKITHAAVVPESDVAKEVMEAADKKRMLVFMTVPLSDLELVSKYIVAGVIAETRAHEAHKKKKQKQESHADGR